MFGELLRFTRLSQWEPLDDGDGALSLGDGLTQRSETSGIWMRHPANEETSLLGARGSPTPMVPPAFSLADSRTRAGPPIQLASGVH
jgi:hypothetical protein